MFTWDLKQRQSNTVAMITFWSQFAVYTINTVFILYLTRPVWKYGLGYSETKAYAFMGVTQAMGYLMPMLGGFMADKVIGLRRSILIGSVLLALAYLLVMISNFTVATQGDIWFIAAYALVPVTNSLLMGTASALVSNVFREQPERSKAGMTIYYMSINIGALLATIIAPQLMDTHYGPLSIFAIVFIGKAVAALNFAYRYSLYDDVIDALDKRKMELHQTFKLVVYIVVIYAITLVLFYYPFLASYVLGVSCFGGLLWFFIRSLGLEGVARTKQLVAITLIVEAIVFFVVYNQMNTTLVLFAKNNSNLHMLGIPVAPANFQMINPIMIILLSFLMPRLYKKFHQFIIPYQFAAGTALAGIGLLVMWLGCQLANNGLVDGNYLVLTYVLITLSELWVSAIGLSMIGLYCEKHMMAFAMGAWYLSVSLSNVLSGRIAGLVALPTDHSNPVLTLPIYQRYYFMMGVISLVVGVAMWGVAVMLKRYLEARQIRVD